METLSLKIKIGNGVFVKEKLTSTKVSPLTIKIRLVTVVYLGTYYHQYSIKYE